MYRANTFDHLHVPFVLKSGSLNLLEISGSVPAFTGDVLPLPLPFVMTDFKSHDT